MSYVTNVDRLDQNIFANLKAENKFIQEMEAAHSEEYFSDLLTDGFGSFYKYKPRVLDENEIPAERRLNRHLMNQVMELAEYKRLRQFTRGNKFHATSALNAVKETFDSLPEEMKDKQKQLDDLQKSLDEELEKEQPDVDGLKKIFQQREEIEKDLDDQYTEHGDTIRQTLRRSLQQAQDDAAEFDDAATALGCGDDPGTIQETPTAQKMKIAQWLKGNDTLIKFAKLAGRMIRIAERKQRQKVDYVREEIENITRGNDLTRLIPYETMKLAHPELAKLFLKDYLENSLFQYSLKGIESQGQGPVLVCVDCSGSMGGEPEVWSKALALALYQIAVKQKRAFGFLLFDTVIHREVFIPKGEKDLDGLIGVLSAFSGGGTAFQPVLERCMDLIEGDEWKQADIVFVTDGYASLSDPFIARFNEVKQAKEFSVIGVRIGAAYAYGETCSLDTFCDDHFDLEGMIAENEDAVFNKAFTI